MSHLGIQANYTNIQAKADPPGMGVDQNGDGVPDDLTTSFRFGVSDLLGQSEHIANLIGIYQDDKMEFRLAYAWRSEYLTTYRDWVTGNPIYVDANGFLDGSFRFDFNEHFQVSASISNILDQKEEAYMLLNTAGQRHLDSRSSMIAGWFWVSVSVLVDSYLVSRKGGDYSPPFSLSECTRTEESNMKRIFGIVASAALLSACATTPAPAPAYEAAPGLDASGWLTAPAEGGRYVVAYTGTKGMSRDQVARYALLRAAEFTAEAGQEWFAVISTKSNNVQVASKEDLRSRSGGGFLGGAGGSSTGAGGAGNTANPQGTGMRRLPAERAPVVSVAELRLPRSWSAGSRRRSLRRSSSSRWAEVSRPSSPGSTKRQRFFPRRPRRKTFARR